MSARFWLFSAACAAGALIGGYGLGQFATTTPRGPSERLVPEMALLNESALPQAEGMTGPAYIRCEGCGPTLADRQWAADAARWDGSSDAEWRAYEASREVLPSPPPPQPAPIPASAPLPPPTSLLPASIERFAAGEGDEPIGSVRIVHAPHDKTPAGDVPAGVVSDP